MKKTILSVAVIGSLIILSGCAEPVPQRTYTADQKAYMCGYWEVVLTGGSQTTHGIKEGGRDSFGYLTYSGTSQKIAARMELYNVSDKPEHIDLLADGTFWKTLPVDVNGRKRPNEKWSFRKQKNGKYFFGTSAYPNTKHALGLGGNWCERVH